MDPITLGLGAQAAIQGISGGIALYKGLTTKVDPRTNYKADPAIEALKKEASLEAKGRMAHMGAYERTADQQAATQQAGYSRAATDASQAFLGVSATTGTRQRAGLQLAQLEAQDLSRRVARKDNATMLASAERAKEIADKQAMRQEQIATKTQLITGGLQGMTSAAGGLASMGMYQQQQAMQEAQMGLLDAQTGYYQRAGLGTGWTLPRNPDGSINFGKD